MSLFLVSLSQIYWAHKAHAFITESALASGSVATLQRHHKHFVTIGVYDKLSSSDFSASGKLKSFIDTLSKDNNFVGKAFMFKDGKSFSQLQKEVNNADAKNYVSIAKKFFTTSE